MKYSETSRRARSRPARAGAAPRLPAFAARRGRARAAAPHRLAPRLDPRTADSVATQTERAGRHEPPPVLPVVYFFASRTMQPQVFAPFSA